MKRMYKDVLEVQYRYPGTWMSSDVEERTKDAIKKKWGKLSTGGGGGFNLTKRELRFVEKIMKKNKINRVWGNQITWDLKNRKNVKVDVITLRMKDKVASIATKYKVKGD